MPPFGFDHEPWRIRTRFRLAARIGAAGSQSGGVGPERPIHPAPNPGDPGDEAFEPAPEMYSLEHGIHVVSDDAIVSVLRRSVVSGMVPRRLKHSKSLTQAHERRIVQRPPMGPFVNFIRVQPQRRHQPGHPVQLPDRIGQRKPRHGQDEDHAGAGEPRMARDVIRREVVQNVGLG